MTIEQASGLDGVVAAETVLSHVDGEAGRLILRGRDLESLAGHVGFEGVVALLWDGFMAERLDEEGVRRAAGTARAAAFPLIERLLPAARGLSPTEGLRLALAALSDESPLPHPILALAAVPVFVAGLARAAAGRTPVAPDPARGQASDFLRMLKDREPTAVEVRALDTYLTTVSDHGLNASTFTARIIASTRAGVLSAVVGALCALKGPLHGGAPGPVLDMLDEIGTVDRIVPWIDGQLAAGKRLMGFGHRIYRVRDPRADVLKHVAASLSNADNRIAFAETVERIALERLARYRPDRHLDTNVEFYTALTLEALDLPRALFTPVFAMGRIAGWTAHVLEQERSHRIIRPQSRYIGPLAHAA